MSDERCPVHAHDDAEPRDRLIRALSATGNGPERIAAQTGVAVEVVREVVDATSGGVLEMSRATNTTA